MGYHLAENRMLLKKVNDLGEHLLYGFNKESNHGWPDTIIDLTTNKSFIFNWVDNSVSRLEVLSLTLEFQKDIYIKKIDKFYGSIWKIPLYHRGLFSRFLNSKKLRLSDRIISIGSWVDSTYEYIRSGCKKQYLKNCFDHAIDAIISYLIQQSNGRKKLTLIKEI